MEGYLGKRGKRMGSRVKRYMRLDGALLSNHHAAAEEPTWRVNVKDATITCNTKRNRIVIELYDNKLELFAETSRECEQWYEALTNAKSKANISAKSKGKENNGTANPVANDINIVSLASDSYEDKDANQRTQLGKNFKVVKPVTRPSAASDESSGGSDEVYDGDQPLVVQGQAYEETPASMIFKQFNFPAK